MNRNKVIAASLVMAVLAACSKRPPPTTAHGPAATSDSETSQQAPSQDGDVLHAEITAGGAPAKYVAHFSDRQLTRIVESRQTTNDILMSDYEFQGARLIRYRGAKLDIPVRLDLEFDMQGVLQPHAGQQVSDEDLRAIRGRAQLLRNHALAQRATRTHAH